MRSQSIASKPTRDRYADRERGDLSEFAHSIHGLSSVTSGAQLEVLRAWDRGDFVQVLDICDDVIEADSWEYERIARARSSPDSGSTNQSGLDRSEDDKKAELYIFHRNVKASVLNKLGRWSDAIKVADDTIRMTKRRDRDSLCLKATALNALGTTEKNRHLDEEALALFTEVLNAIPPGGHDLEASLNQATLYFKLGKVDEALRSARQALDYVTIEDEEKFLNDDLFADIPNESSQPLLNGAQSNNGASSSSLNNDSHSLTTSSNRVPQKGYSFEYDAEKDAPSPLLYRQTGLDREHIKYDPDLRLLMSAILSHMKRHEDAISECKLGVKAAKRKGALGSAVLLRILEIQMTNYALLNRYAEAELVAKMLAKMDPYKLDRLEPHLHMMLRANKPYEEILETVNSYESHVSDDIKLYPVFLKMKLHVFDRFQKADEALKVCEQLIKMRAELEVAYPTIVMSKLRKGLGQEAIEACEDAEREGMISPDLMALKAIAYESMNDFDSALLIHEAVVSKFPNFGVGHFRYANALARIGKNDDALKGYDRALALDAGTGTAQVLMAKATLLRNIGRLKESLETYAQVAKYNPEVAKQLPGLLRQFKAGNPANFVSPETIARAQEIKQTMAKSGINPSALTDMYKNFGKGL